jgi:hypothetical protein
MAMTLHTVDLAPDPELGGDQLEWTDEFGWDPVAQEQERSLSGALHISEGQKLYGRPISLASNDGAWFTLSTVRALEALRDRIGIQMLLTLPTGTTHYVTWNRTEGAPLEAKPLWRRVNPSDDELYQVTLRLITVAPPTE